MSIPALLHTALLVTLHPSPPSTALTWPALSTVIGENWILPGGEGKYDTRVHL